MISAHLGGSVAPPWPRDAASERRVPLNGELPSSRPTNQPSAACGAPRRAQLANPERALPLGGCTDSTWRPLRAKARRSTSGVPHLSCSALVAAPDETRNRARGQGRVRQRRVVCQALGLSNRRRYLGSRHRASGVPHSGRSGSVPPSGFRPHLRQQRHAPSRCSADWCLFDHEAAIRDAHDKPRVVEVREVGVDARCPASKNRPFKRRSGRPRRAGASRGRPRFGLCSHTSIACKLLGVGSRRSC